MADNCHLSRSVPATAKAPGQKNPANSRRVPVVPVVPAAQHTDARMCMYNSYYLPGQVGQMGQTAVARGFALSRLAFRTGTNRDRSHAP